MLKHILFKIVPRSLYLKYIRRRSDEYKQMDTGELFSEIYSQRLWGGDPSDEAFCSGLGTINPNAGKYITFLKNFLRENHITNIVEVGCGDFKIMRQVLADISVDSYTGLDVAANVIAYNQKKLTTDKIRFECRNAVTEAIPAGDCLIIRQVLQHLGNEQIANILSKTKVFEYVLITEHLPLKVRKYNIDKIQGPDIRLYDYSGVFIEQPPFSLKNAETVLEYPEDITFMHRNIPAVLRTSLVRRG